MLLQTIHDWRTMSNQNNSLYRRLKISFPVQIKNTLNSAQNYYHHYDLSAHLKKQ